MNKENYRGENKKRRVAPLTRFLKNQENNRGENRKPFSFVPSTQHKDIQPLFLALEDLEGFIQEELVRHLVSEYTAPLDLGTKYYVLIAYESVGDYGCDSSSFFLLQSKKTGELFELHGSHCSCNGFENQWDLTATSLVYLKSDNFYFGTGGYDSNSNSNDEAVNNFIRDNL